jgi:hypothetical protein
MITFQKVVLDRLFLVEDLLISKNSLGDVSVLARYYDLDTVTCLIQSADELHVGFVKQ